MPLNLPIQTHRLDVYPKPAQDLLFLLRQLAAPAGGRHAVRHLCASSTRLRALYPCYGRHCQHELTACHNDLQLGGDVQQIFQCVSKVAERS